ncbi:hypothetical protein CBS147355_1790 [Penicillium roqueforti]|nr:hypothetical protein CBS147355_1790 [Penicillium roqueforti]KAI2687445.1 hypothetical protein LCP963914a_4046 [Penicillium roqueforti]KAI2724767.1 hypothetical protein CBS147318_1698 [Penicillium roqueforti]KAI3178405.1 hypothetical protein DTO039G3_1764 [Penicillium roqueforti]
MWTGWITISLGVGSMSLLGLQSSRSLQFGLQVPGGIGVGVLYTIIAIPLQATMHVDDVGLAVGTLVFFRLTGQIIGLAISAAIFSNTYTTRASRWENLPAIAEQFRDGSAAVYAIGKLSSLDGYPSKDTQKHLEDIQKNLEDTQIDLEEAQKALIKYERTFDAYTIEVQSIVLDKWAGKSISNTRRSQRNAAAHGGSILAD